MVDYTEGSGKQYHIRVSGDDIGKYVILPGDPGRVELIGTFFDDAHFVANNREFMTCTGTLKGVKVSVVSTGIGGPSAAIALEELVKCGAHTFIRMGTCGGMQDDVMGGDVVIASAAVRMEGTSRQYAPIEYPAVAHFDVVNALVNKAREMKLRYHLGVVQSKDSFFGQHEPEKMPVSYELMNKWESYIRMGCLASEMETAALLTVGQYLRVRVGACFLCIANQEREKKGLPNTQVHDNVGAVTLVCDALESMIEEDLKKGAAL